jgi:hypothetical protein
VVCLTTLTYQITNCSSSHSLIRRNQRFSGEQEDEEDLWYDQPFDAEDSNNKSVDPCFTLPPGTSTVFIIPKRSCKVYSTGARIKVTYMLEEKKLVRRILEATGVSR